MSRLRPTTLDNMSRIRGIGEKRLNTYGEEFLTAVLTYCEQAGVESDI